MSATVFSQANFVFHGHISYKAELNSFQVLIGLNGHVTLAKTASLVSQETEISNISDIYHFNNRPQLRDLAQSICRKHQNLNRAKLHSDAVAA